MQLTNTPGKLVLPFANAGAKNTIPTASQIGITAGAASLTDGFPPLTRTPIAAGGVPPSGLDMNGILFQLSAILRWANAGGGYAYDAAFATDSNVNGYPKGARIMRSDGLGYWFNTVENNTTDPEAAGAAAAGWVPDFTNGVTSVAMASANVTLTPLQYGKPIIVITGTLTANLNLIFPTLVNEWTVINNTTGPYTITCKTAAGTGITLASGGKIRIIWGDGTNIYGAVNAGDTAAQFDNSTSFATTAFVQSTGKHYQPSPGVSVQTSITLPVANSGHWFNVEVASLTLTLPIMSAAQSGLMVFTLKANETFTLQRGGTDAIELPGLGVVNSFSVVKGECVEITANGTGRWYVTNKALGGNFVFGFNQTYQNVTASRASGVTYTNTTGKPIAVMVKGNFGSTGFGQIDTYVNATPIGSQISNIASSGYFMQTFFVVPDGATYQVNIGGSATPTLSTWFELR